MKFDSTLTSEIQPLASNQFSLIEPSENSSLTPIEKEMEKDKETKAIIDFQSTFNNQEEDDNMPWAKMKINDLIKDFVNISISSLLISFSYFSNLILLLINLHFIGDEGDPVLISAVGLGNVWINSLGINTIYGLNYGFEVMASKAYGSDDFFMVGVYYKKGLLLIIIVLSMFSGLSAISSYIFLLLGQSPAVTDEVYVYVLYMLPALWFAAFFDLRALYLNAQEVFAAPITIQIFTTAGHIGWCILFTKYGMTIKGIAMAMNITMFLNYIILEMYCYFFSPRKQSIAPWCKLIFKDFKEYMIITIPIAMTTVLEEFSYEINSIMAGLMNETILAAHVAMANSGSLFYCLPEGFSTGINSFVGISIGEKKKHKARRFALLGIIGGLIIICLCYLFLYFFRDQWALFFTDEPGVNGLMTGTVWYFIGVGLIDTLQMTIGAVLKVTGRGKIALIMYFMCLYVIANPMSFIFGNVLGWELKGIWLGIIIGVSFLAGSFLIVAARINWQTEIDNAENNEEVKELMEGKD